MFTAKYVWTDGSEVNVFESEWPPEFHAQFLLYGELILDIEDGQAFGPLCILPTFHPARTSRLGQG